MEFIEAHEEAYGIEPICAVLPIAPSTYYEQKTRQADLERRPADRIAFAPLPVLREAAAADVDPRARG